MNKNKNYLNNYENVFEEVKYTTNSIIRLKILAALYQKPQNMKELTKTTKLKYSSISNILHGLELNNLIYHESNKYHLTNALKIQIQTVLEIKEVINLLNDFFNILDGHIVDIIPEQSVAELYLLGKANLLESNDVDAYKIYNYIENTIKEAEKIQCILPFYHVNFNKKFNTLVKKRKHVEIIVSEEIHDIYEKEFKGKNNFLLIVTDKTMILGLFKENGFFDQNRILTSKNKDSLKWANNLFKNFKNKKIK